MMCFNLVNFIYPYLYISEGLCNYPLKCIKGSLCLKKIKINYYYKMSD